jgi:hypothetical protein
MRRLLVSLAALATLALGPAALAQSSYPPSASAADVAALQLGQAESYVVTLDASGNSTVTFSPAFSAPPRAAYFPKNSDTSGKPIVCNYQTLTATAITFHCDKGTGPITALLQPVFGSTGAAGAEVLLIARGTMVAAQ